MKIKTGNTTFKIWTYFANSTTLFSRYHRSNLQKRRENNSPPNTNKPKRHIETFTFNKFFCEGLGQARKGLGHSNLPQVFRGRRVGGNSCVVITQTVCLIVDMDGWRQRFIAFEITGMSSFSKKEEKEEKLLQSSRRGDLNAVLVSRTFSLIHRVFIVFLSIHNIRGFHMKMIFFKCNFMIYFLQS